MVSVNSCVAIYREAFTCNYSTDNLVASRGFNNLSRFESCTINKYIMHTYSTCCAVADVFYDGRGLGSSV